jgi:hypothetical protein
MARKSGGKEKGQKARKKLGTPGMARDATAVQTPSPGSAGASNMMDRILPGPTRARMVVSQVTFPRRQGKPIKSRRKT